jgi:hypothetical protein
MIKTESMTINGKAFIRTFSDSGYMVERDGVRYGEAIDPAELNRLYTETDELIESDMTETEEKARAYDILMGVAE